MIVSPSVNGHAKPLKLHTDHLSDLRKSGLSDATIKLCGFYTEDQAPIVNRILHWTKGAGKLGPCLVIPYFTLDGARIGDYMRLRPSRPIKDKDGKPRKYEAPKGRPSRIYTPPFPDLHAAIADPAKAIVITEGEKKTAEANQQGIPTIGLAGVNMWNRPSTYELRDDLQLIAWSGRPVFICFDSDAATNRNVRAAELKLAEALQKAGAVVRIVRLPAGPPEADGTPGKIGLDDFLVSNDAVAFWALADKAESPTAADGDSLGDAKKEWEVISDPHYLTRCFLKEHRHADRTRLAYYRNSFWAWDGKAWRLNPDTEMRAMLASFVKRHLDFVYRLISTTKKKDAPQADGADGGTSRKKPLEAPKVTTGMIANVVQALAGEVLLPQTTPMPKWLCPGRAGTDYIALANGILDVNLLLRGASVCLLPHSPDWFSPVCLSYPFDPNADCPKWRAFLNKNLSGEHSDKARLLQQYAGYLLVFDTSAQRFLMMLGDGSNGKSVICSALRAMLGEENVSSVSLEKFGLRFELEPTLGKLANIVPEVGELERADEAQLKAFVSGDPMRFEQKFKAAYTATPTARLVLATNNAPEFRDKSDGIWRRVLLLKFDVQIPGSQAIAGMDKVSFWHDERSGILNWALAGLKDLRDQGGRFIVPQALQEDIDKLRSEASAARRFLQEHYEPGGGNVEKAIVYGDFKRWCQDNGHCPMASNKFAAEVYRLFKTVRETQETLPVLDVAGQVVRDASGTIKTRRARMFAGLERQQQP